tara:strand:+ start:206 stop:445 length:240 start_codon:yes stop_codon:yes gene_type:complete
VYFYAVLSRLSEALHSLQYVKCNKVGQRAKNVTDQAGKAFLGRRTPAGREKTGQNKEEREREREKKGRQPGVSVTEGNP